MHVPLKTLISFSEQSSGHFLAKSGICVKSEQRNTYVYGFGFNKIKENARKASQFEALERLWATYAIHQGKEDFIGYSLKISNEHRTFSSSQVLISSIVNFKEKSADANGLGCHPVMDQALNHAVLELIERHLLAEIWYEDGLVFELKEKAIIREDGWHVQFYTSHIDVPLAIAIVSNSDKTVWVLGSALRESFLQSMEHAKNEAFMLLESAFFEKGIAYSKDIEMRLSSLKDKQCSQAREDFFQSKVSNKNKQKDVTSKIYLTKEIIERVLGNHSIWIVNLFEDVRMNVVRAICDFAKNPRWFRDLQPEFIPLDPFC